ncbi:MAG: MBL fold metallo-hydrolase [Candidatus Heimdallarchaeota archaeon]|nr:MBL fold metallo-hydrolase [Candidatus Heimdallarchaeota archaeon]
MSIDYSIFVTPGLGDNSYLIKSGDEAAVIDPQRDAWRFITAAEEQNVGIKYVLETHVHNDYITGALEIHDKTGAELAIPADGHYEFQHKPMQEGDSIKIGDLEIKAWATPGHTLEHMSWLVSDQDNIPQAIFTGGSLLVGSAGRTDLLGEDYTDQLTRSQFSTVHRISKLPDSVTVLPTHGGGSFCTASNTSTERITTIGNERMYNQAMLCRSVDDFISTQLTGLLRYPSYYPYMAPMNRAGPKVYGKLELPPQLSESEYDDEIERKTHVIDIRKRADFAKGYLEGSLNVELTPSFGTYIGWILPYNDPILLIVDEPLQENLVEATTQLFRIGIDNIKGYISTETNFFKSRSTGKFQLSTFKELKDLIDMGQEPMILDVRDPQEWETTGVLPNTKKVFLPEISANLEEMRREYGEGEVYTICVSGERASVSTSLLRTVGIKAKTIYDGGINDLIGK